MKSGFQSTKTVIVVLLVLAGALFLLVLFGVGPLLRASHLPGGRAERAYAAFSALFGLVALGGAAIAVAFAWPSFYAWVGDQVRHPNITLSFELSTDKDTPPHPVSNRVHVEGLAFYLRVKISNAGRVTLRNGIVNIGVPVECTLTVLDGPDKQHFLSAMPTLSNILNADDGEPDRPIRWSVAFDTFTTSNDFFFHVRVKTPRPGDWMVGADIAGEPSVKDDQSSARLSVTTSTLPGS